MKLLHVVFETMYIISTIKEKSIAFTDIIDKNHAFQYILIKKYEVFVKYRLRIFCGEFK